MSSTVRKVLGIDGTSDYVRMQLERVNRDILRYESVFIAIVALSVTASSLFPIVPWLDKPDYVIAGYRIGLVVIALASIVCRIACTKIAKAEDRSLAATRFVLIAYTAFLLIAATALTVWDYAVTGSFFIYVVALVLVFGLLFIQPIVTIALNVVYAAILIGILTALGFGSAIMALTLGAYAFIVTVVSISNYQTRVRAMQANEKVRHVSRHDSLTGTKNRHAVTQDAAGALGREMYLLLGDIDDFKFYNDSYGHTKGDELLCKFADSMCDAFGHANVYRYGGDEFIAIALDVEEAEFQRRVAKWRESFEGVEVDGERFVPTTSGGYVHGTPQTTDEMQDMLRLADVRLFDAKQAGRNKVLGMEYEGGQAAAEALDAASLRERRSSNADPLTGLPSMTYFSVHAKALLESPALADSAFHLVYFNIENMKAYNERFGMAAGDDLIVFTAREIESAFEHALVTRVGDDRFALITYDGDPIAGIERVYEGVRAHNNESNTVIRAGVYEYERGVQVSTACDLAKLACDHIKGRHNVYHYVYDESLHEKRERTQFILDRFEDALENDGIQAYYQPIIRSTSGRISEFEALARWIDPIDGFISPADFIPVLEEYRLVHLLDLRIIEVVCRDMRALSSEGLQPLPANVNLSRYDMELCDIVEETAKIMRRYGIAPDMVNIEITESAFSENTALLEDCIKRFHDLGMQVWMDDFGSGYSSLNVLKAFDFDVVKFDMFFLRYRDEASRIRTRMMIPHLVSMAKELGVQTLAEGVETEGQYEFLRSVGCEKVQGFAFDKPSPVQSVRDRLVSGELLVEEPGEREYYNPIGHVDLATPYSIDQELARSIEMSGGMPAAIVEFRDGRVSYLRWNSSYIDYLQDIGMNTIENSTAQMNDLSRPQSQGFFKAAEYLRGKPEWLDMSFYEDQDLCTGMARCVAVDEKTGAAAFLYIAFNVTRYLARAGLSTPEKSS